MIDRMVVHIKGAPSASHRTRRKLRYHGERFQVIGCDAQSFLVRCVCEAHAHAVLWLSKGEIEYAELSAGDGI